MADAGLAALAAFAEEIGRLGDVIEQTAKAAAPKLAARVAEGFKGGFAPSGTSWAPLSPSTLSRGRSAPPLTDTGALSSTMRSLPGATQIVMSATAPYSSFHQFGTKNMPARPILPEGDALPQTWRQDLEDACIAALERKLGK